MTAIILNLSYTGLGIARDLSKKGIKVIGLWSDKNQFGRFTKCANTLQSPSAKKNPEALLKFLINLGKNLHTKAIIFPTNDFDVLFLTQNKKLLSSYFFFPLPSIETIKKIMNKYILYKEAKKIDIPTPKTFFIKNKNELFKIKEKIKFPCLIKPIFSYIWHKGSNWTKVGGQKAIKCNNYQELILNYHKLQFVSTDIIIQEFIPGEDDQIYIYGTYLDKQSCPLGYFTARKLLQYPLDIGTGCLVEIINNPEIAELGLKLLRHFDYHGIAEVEFKKDSHDGKYKLIEINPRPWDWMSLGTKAGVNLAYLAYVDLLGIQPENQDNNYSQNLKWIAEESLLRVFIGSILRKNNCSPVKLLKLLKGKKIYGIFFILDPVPFSAFLIRFIYLTLKSKLSKMTSLGGSE